MGGRGVVSRQVRAFLLLLAAVAGCGGPPPVTPPSPVSPPPFPAPVPSPGLRAGFGRADITPPPGLGLAGYGPSAGTARGHRHRLYARALVLEDPSGERVALVVADLSQMSLLLQREVAARTEQEVGIGADRLVLAATHAHAGPGHFYSDEAYNIFAAGRPGFDPRVVTFLADRIAESVLKAGRRTAPAVAAWVQEPVWGLTENRSPLASDLNPPVPGRPVPPDGLSGAQRSVDPTWSLLRVDTLTASGDTVPAGAFSVFAFHPTGNPPANDLYDGDVSAIIERGLERHMDRLSGTPPDLVPRSLHLLANGAEGDVSLAERPEMPCEPERPVRPARPGGPRTPAGIDEWRTPSRAPGSDCFAAARRFVNAMGDSLAWIAVGIYDRARHGLRSDLTLVRSFRTVSLTGPDAPAGLCAEPEVGSGAAAGAEDGRSALFGWRALGLIPLHAAEGEVEPDRRDCQAPKRPLHWILRAGVGGVELPKTMQLAVVRVGEMLLAAVPAEPTTEVGFRLREALLAAAESSGVPATSAVVVGLANGYLQYVATEEEYQAQHYEGGSTLYGPGAAGALEGELEGLVADLASGGSADVGPVDVRPGKPRALLPEGADALPPLRLEGARCAGDTVVVRWLDAPPGTLIPADGPIVSLARRRPGADDLRVWDDDRHLELRALEGRGRRGHLWEARWTPRGGAEGSYEAVVRWRPPPAVSWEFTCP